MLKAASFLKPYGFSGSPPILLTLSLNAVSYVIAYEDHEKSKTSPRFWLERHDQMLKFYSMSQVNVMYI